MRKLRFVSGLMRQANEVIMSGNWRPRRLSPQIYACGADDLKFWSHSWFRISRLKLPTASRVLFRDSDSHVLWLQDKVRLLSVHSFGIVRRLNSMVNR